MQGLFILLFFLLFLIDSLVISFARKLLFDFLVGQNNKKIARNIHRQQKFINKITMRYIKANLNQNLSTFKIFHCIYMIEIFTLIPQYIILLAIFIFAGNFANFILLAFFAIKFLLFIVYWWQFDANRVSKFRKKS